MLVFCSVTVSLSFFLQLEAPVYLVPWQVFAQGCYFSFINLLHMNLKEKLMQNGRREIEGTYTEYHIK